MTFPQWKTQPGEHQIKVSQVFLVSFLHVPSAEGRTRFTSRSPATQEMLTTRRRSLRMWNDLSVPTALTATGQRFGDLSDTLWWCLHTWLDTYFIVNPDLNWVFSPQTGRILFTGRNTNTQRNQVSSFFCMGANLLLPTTHSKKLPQTFSDPSYLSCHIIALMALSTFGIMLTRILRYWSILTHTHTKTHWWSTQTYCGYWFFFFCSMHIK